MRPIRKFRNPKYKMTLYIYPVADCGEDLQTGDPLEVSSEGEDLYEMKCGVNELILNTMTAFNANDGKCFIEVRIEKDDEYFDCDEWWVSVNLAERTVTRGGI